MTNDQWTSIGVSQYNKKTVGCNEEKTYAIYLHVLRKDMGCLLLTGKIDGKKSKGRPR